MTIEEVERAARKEGLSYGQYVFKHFPHDIATAKNDNKSKTINIKSLRPCKKYTIQGVFSAEYSSVADAAAAQEISTVSIEKALKGETFTAGGYQWRYSDDPTPVEEKLVICQYDPGNKLVATYSTLKEASASCSCAPNIKRALKTGIKAGGYYWRYKRLK